MTEEIISNQDETINTKDVLDIFIPITIKKRVGRAMVIMPNFEENQQANQNQLDEKIINLIAKAYRWKISIDKTPNLSLAQIAEKEKLSKTYVSRIYNLNFLSPKIIQAILDGTIDSTNIKIREILKEEMSFIWEEQEERWGI